MTSPITLENRNHVDRTEIDSLTTSSNRNARIWNWLADRYAAKPVANEGVYQRKLAITRQHLHAQAQVLELGCGTGSTALAHASFVKQIKAVDLSSRMIEIARHKAAAADIRNVDFLCNAVENIRLPKASVDAVLILNVLHLIADWRRQITEAHHTLRFGGVLVSSTPCMSDDFAFMRYLVAAGQIAGLLPTLRFFTQHDLKQTMIDAGFKIETVWQPAPKSAVFIVARKCS